MNQKDLFETVLTERMEWHYKKFDKEVKRKTDSADEQYQKIIAKLSHEEIVFLNEYIDNRVNAALDYNEKFYRAGIHDGIRIDRYIQKIKNEE